MTMLPVRVGFLVKTFPRLSETFILNEILGLEEMGWNLHIYSLKRPSEEPVHPGVAHVKAPVDYVPSLRPAGTLLDPVRTCLAHLRLLGKRPVRYFSAMARYFRTTQQTRLKEWLQAGSLAVTLEKEGITHLHAHFANTPTAIAEIVHWLTGIPFSFTAHAKDIYTTDELDLARRMGGAAAVFTCTAFNAHHLRGIAGSKAPIELVYHGIDTARFAPLRGRSAQDVRGEIPIVLSIGRFSEKKGLEDLMRACAILRDKGMAFRCVMVGYGALEERLKQLRRELGLETVVEMPGRLAQPQVIEQYRRAAVFALPCVVLENGDRDGIPNVLLESMAAGVPVVTTHVSGISEVLEEGQTGWMVEPHHPAMLAERIEFVLNHREEAAAVASRARMRIEKDFTLAANAQRVHNQMRAAVIAGLSRTRSPWPVAAAPGESNA